VRERALAKLGEEERRHAYERKLLSKPKGEVKREKEKQK
jgi:hypothetical protein